VSDLVAMFNAKVDVQTATTTRDKGGIVETYAVSQARVPCYIEQASAQEAVNLGAERETRLGKATFLPTQTITSNDRLVWNGRVLQVLGSNLVSSSFDGIDARLVVDWQEVRGAA
jgi:head-tail adaptor